MADTRDVLGGIDPSEVRVRFPPSPTGNLHVGNVRSAMFNWAFARHFGGTFVLRLEDTDAARSTAESRQNVLDSLRWLGLDWDEGPEVGGPHGPYEQSQRRDQHLEIAAALVEGGFAYRDHYTKEESDALGEDAIHRDPANPCPTLSAETIAERDAAGAYVIRMHVPDQQITFDDLVRGQVTFEAANVPDYVIVRANGDPLYPLVNPVDDALMGITHVLRGEDLLSSTPRQIVMYQALAAIGVGSGRTPRFGHLPIVMGAGNKRLSKRDAGAGLAEYQERGFLPEGLLNYLALLGWAIAEDRDVFTMAEMIEAFDVRRVNSNPARFDPKKAEAINAEHIRLLTDAELVPFLVPHLVAAGLVQDPPTASEQQLIDGIAPLVRTRMNTVGEVVALAGFLFRPDAEIEIEEKVRPKPEDAATLDAGIEAVAACEPFTAEALEAALRAALIDGLELKPRHAFGPLRSAVSGAKVSPPLFESMELLGRESALTRLRAARDLI